jgi:GT2 family glycosyltransferase
MIDVTVSIVHASKPELTLDCLASLGADVERRCSVEIVVLDNASGDRLAAATEELAPEVRLIEQRHRSGFGANQNTIIRATRSRYVFVLNPDTRIPSGAIDGLVDYLDLHPEAAVAGPLIRGFDGVQQGSAWRLVTVPVQLVWALTLGQHGAVVSRGDKAKRVGAVAGSAMLVRREALEEAGLFDEAYFMFSEEAELARRFERLGVERHYVPTVEVLHLGQESTSHVPERQINEFWRSFDLYLSRYHSPFEARLLRWLCCRTDSRRQPRGPGIRWVTDYMCAMRTLACGSRASESLQPTGIAFTAWRRPQRGRRPTACRRGPSPRTRSTRRVTGESIPPMP